MGGIAVIGTTGIASSSRSQIATRSRSTRRAITGRARVYYCAYLVFEAAGELQPNRLKESDGSELLPLSRRQS
jgi:cobalamin biosynthesis protein CbiD